jgi:hypothetical protein
MSRSKRIQMRAVLLSAWAVLEACQWGAKDKTGPVFELQEKIPSQDLRDADNVWGGQDRASRGAWPASLREHQLICENTRATGQRASSLLGLNLAAGAQAGAQVLFFRDILSGSIPNDLQKPLLVSATNKLWDFDLFFEGKLQSSRSDRLMERQDYIFWTSLSLASRQISETVERWAPLAARRLSRSRWSENLPAWLRVRDSLSLRASEGQELLILAQQDQGDVYRVYSQFEDQAMSLELPLNKAFIANSFQDERFVAFQVLDEEQTALELNLYDAFNDEVLNFSKQGFRYFVASDARSDSLWFWGQEASSAQWTLFHYNKNSQQHQALWQSDEALLIQRISRSLSDDWLVAQDEQKQIEWRHSESFELMNARQYPVGAQRLVSINELPQTPSVLSLEFQFGEAQNRVYLLNLETRELRGPIGRSFCSGSVVY